jgi:methylphosphotriester-DNA--protein-cysteine methyltransferase
MGSRRYTEWQAPADLRDAVICLWSAAAAHDAQTIILPDRCSDLIWEQGRGASEQVAAEVGLSMRQLRRRCHETVGYGPKTLQRVMRFRRFVSRIDAGDQDLAAIAAAAGYVDRTHLTRECLKLADLTPAALAKVRGAG